MRLLGKALEYVSRTWKWTVEKSSNFATWLKKLPSRTWRYLKKKYQEFMESHEAIAYFLRNYVPYVLGYGLVFNFMVFALLGARFNVYTIIGYGLLVYFVKEELVEFINEVKRG